MNKMRLLASVLALGVGFTAVIDDAEAARRTSLAGNRLILDRTDTQIFPQLVLDYTNLLALDYGAAAGSGSGLGILGSETMAFGLGLYRGDVLDYNLFPHELGHPYLGGPDNLLGGAFPAPHTILDLMFGLDLGAGLLGVRLAFGNGGNSLTPADPDIGSSESSQTFVRTDLGFSLRGNFRLDMALHLIFNGASVTAGDPVFDGSVFELGLTARAFMPLAAGVDLGILGDVVFDTARVTNYGGLPSEDFDTTANSFGLLAGAGPVYTIDGVTTLAGYAVLGVLTTSGVPNTEADDNAYTEYSTSSIIIPGFHVAADIYLTEWLYFRSGMQYMFARNSRSDLVPPDGNTQQTTSRVSDFGWRAGLGLQLGNFALDGALQHGFLTAGPNFLGGQSPGLFSSVAASYRF
ncbi:MAG: hypothetical protein H0U74_04625 [Bradymonadaceae bacterium]|nr:hypothetical protein [Lujinxingiaceae bacterium]